MKKLSIYTTNEQWEHVIINRIRSSKIDRPLNKLLKLDHFACYMQLTPDDVLSNFGADSKIEEKMGEFSMETRNFEGKKESKRTSKEHILLPMSLEIKLTHCSNSVNNTKPRYEGFFTINNLSLNMHKDQFDKALLISGLIKKYQHSVIEKEKVRKFKKFRPLYSVLTKDAGEFKTTKVNTGGAVLWWKYAITCIIKKLHEDKGEKGLFDISQISMQIYQKKFMLYYTKIINKVKLTEKESMEYTKILGIFDYPQLKLWTSKVHKKIEKKIYEIQPKEENTITTSLLTSLFQLIGNEEEEKELENEKQAKLIANSLHGIMEQTPDPEAKIEIVNKQPKIEEYIWLNVGFTINKVEVIIERDKIRKKGENFKEGIDLEIWKLQAKVKKRYWESDFQMNVGDLKLTTFSCFNSSENLNNVILSRSKHFEESKEDFASAEICFTPFNPNLLFTINVKMQSVRVYFLPLLISRLTTFMGQQESSTSSNPTREENKNPQEDHKSELEQKKSSISISVDAPTILVPIYKNNDISSPIWCFCLGDLKMETGFEKMYANPHYTSFQVTLDKIRLEYFCTLMAYEKYEKENYIDPIQRFGVIDDFTIHMNIAFARDKKDPATPSADILCDIEKLNMNFTPSIYNHFINISDSFDLTEDDEAWKELIREKDIIVKSQRIGGTLHKRGIGDQKFWYKKYCILSGGYLYFYESNRENFPTSYFYLKNTEIVDGTRELGIANSMILRNKLEQCFLKFINRIEYNNWKTKITETIQSINNLSAISSYQVHPKEDYTDLKWRTLLEIKLFEVNIVNEDLAPFAQFICTKTHALIEKPPADLIYNLTINEIQLISPNIEKCSKIIEINSLNILSSSSNKESPLFKGELSSLTIEFDEAICYYPPNFIQTLMEILKNTKLNLNPVQMEDQSKGEHLPAEQPENESLLLDTCNNNKYVISRIIATLNNLHLYLLHPIYNTPFCLIDITNSVIDFTSFIDHEVIKAQIRNFIVYDLTNYPDTLSPDSVHFEEEKIDRQKIVEINSGGIDEIFEVEHTTYQLHCPKRPTTPDNLQGQMFIKVYPIIINLYFEYFVSRFADYLIYQFFESMSSKESTVKT